MKKFSFFDQKSISKLLLCGVFICFVFYPFFQMMLNITKEDITTILSSRAFVPAVLASLKCTLTTTAISIPLGFLLAFCINRTNIPCKGLFQILLILPMLIPSISHSTGLIVLFGTNGILRNLLGMEGTIYGFWGIVIGSVLYSYPVAFLMFSDALKYEDGSPYEAATVLGIPAKNRLFAITLPYLKKPFISAVFSVFTMVITDYGVPIKIGGQITTLATLMYQKVIGQFRFGEGATIGLLLLFPALIAFLFNIISKRQSKMGFITKPMNIKKSIQRDTFAFVFCVAIIGCILLMLGAFGVIAFTEKYPSNMTFTFSNIQKLFATGGSRALKNSILISIVVAFVGSIVAFISAYFTSRTPSKLSHVLHLFSITSLAIPGTVLGLSYSMTFSGSFFYRSLLILIVANMMHFFASPYQMMYNSLASMNENLEHVGQTLGINRFRIVRDVILPQSFVTLIEMFSYFFVNSMMTISAVSFLANSQTKPISLIIEQFNAQGNYEIAAVVAIIILFANLLVKGSIFVITNLLKKRTLKMRKTGE